MARATSFTKSPADARASVGFSGNELVIMQIRMDACQLPLAIGRDRRGNSGADLGEAAADRGDDIADVVLGQLRRERQAHRLPADAHGVRPGLGAPTEDLLITVASSGGARMQEGIFSLMQMARVSAAIAKLSESGILYISILADPTFGGVTASFAMLGDVIIAEPRSLIGFAGPRVIEQTIKQQLSEDFQRAEFLLDHGLIDIVVDRKALKKTIGQIIGLLA